MLNILVTDDSQVGEARRLITRLTAKLNFSEIDIANAAIIVSEAANNLLKHTPQGGEIIIDCFPVDLEGYCGAINLYVLDKGPGMANITQCLTDGYSTAGTNGEGLGAMQRLSSSLDIYSIPNAGTALWVQIIALKSSMTKIPRPLPSIPSFSRKLGCISVPIKGELLCGDGWAVDYSVSYPNEWYLVVDGLGHGEGAFEAADEAIKAFNMHVKKNLSVENLFQKIHFALNKTRGAAAAIAKINYDSQTLEYIGIGNIASVLLSAGSHKNLISLNGIVGHGVKKLQVFTYPLPKDFTLLMCSDGLGTHLNLDKYPGLLQKPAPLIAGVLYRDYKRMRDDVTVLVIRSKA